MAKHVVGLKNDEKELDVEVREVCVDVLGKDPKDIIMDERLDEKGSMLMDGEFQVISSDPIVLIHSLSVPHLPPPSVHKHSTRFLPQTLKDVTADVPLKKIAGLKSLNMELSWRPFHFGSKLPTNEQVARVDSLDWNRGSLEEAILPPVDASKINNLLASVQTKEQDLCDPHWQNDEEDDMFSNVSRNLQFGPILTRSDRCRLAGISEAISDAEDEAFRLGEESHHAGPPAMGTSTKAIQPIVQEKSGFLLESIGSAERRNTPNDSGISLVDLTDQIEDEHIEYFCFSEDDKENLPPSHKPSNQAHLYSEQQQDTNIDDNREFEPLSFGSGSNLRELLPCQSEVNNGEMEEQSFAYPGKTQWQDAAIHNEDIDLDFPTETFSRFELPPSQNHLQPPSPPTNESNFASRSLAQFLQLKNQSALAEKSTADLPATITECVYVPVLEAEGIPEVHTAPESILDRNTLILPSPWFLPSTAHRYLASVNFVQKRSIVSALASQACAVDLTERETLDGVDIILDPHTAVIFASLGSLPLQSETLASRLADQSWRYSRLLVILEAFSSSSARKRNQSSSLVNPYTPPTIRAINKLRRSLGIMDGCDSKRHNTSIHLAFADTVEQAAMFTRCFGDCAEANDTTGGMIWGSREWLDNEEQEVNLPFILDVWFANM